MQQLVTIRLRQQAQTGAALITAMLLAALIVMLSAAWLSRFDTQLRTVEAQRAGTQARWLQRAATDWARMILQEDSQNVDHLREVWAVPIAAVRITDVAGVQEAFFSGQLQDAQGLFNAGNLRGQPTVTLQVWAVQLAQQAGLSAQQAQTWVKTLATAHQDTLMLTDVLPTGLTLVQQQAMERYFVWLPAITLLNVNTADQAVLASHPNIGAAGAATIVRYRETAHFKDKANIASVLQLNSNVIDGTLGVSSAHFFATGRVTVGRMDIMAKSLIQRQPGNSTIVWTLAL